MDLLLRIVAVLQIAGGFFAMSGGLRALLAGQAGVVGLIGIALGAFALVAGVLLMEGHAQGERLSRIVQGLQIPLLATPWFGYAWHVGAALPMHVRLAQPATVGIDWSLPSHGLRLTASGPSTAVIGINVLALIAFLLLLARR